MSNNEKLLKQLVGNSKKTLDNHSKIIKNQDEMLETLSKIYEALKKREDKEQGDGEGDGEDNADFLSLLEQAVSKGVYAALENSKIIKKLVGDE